MKKRTKRILLILAGIIALVIAGGALFMSMTAKNLEAVGEVELIDIDLSSLADGDYSGTYKVFPITAETKVTIKDHEIIEIELVKHVSGQGGAASAIPAMVVEAQSLQVDTVSGATYSSKIILKSIENALMSARTP